MLVRDHMSPDPITVGPEDTLRRVRDLMREKGLRRFPVVKNGMLVGIVTDRDVRQADISSQVAQERRYVDYVLDRILVSGIMTPNPITVEPDTAIAEAAALILDKRIGGLPVVSGDELAGIITETDLIKALIKVLGQGRGPTTA